MDNNEWIERAKGKIINLPIGTKFEVKELFEEIDWKALSRGERVMFGKIFANEVREGKISSIIALERGRNNHSKYEKQGE
ncbi:MAG: single-stranded DNA-binding protein [Ruminococcus sp.]|nr:single-stranded DNA-binding protein [Ruminococcus sp.]